MNESRSHQELNGSGDRYLRRAAEGTRPSQRAGTHEPVRRERQGDPASSRIRRQTSVRAVQRREAEQRRRDRVLGHTIVGSMALGVFVAMLPISGSLPTFAIATVAFFVGLRSLTFAMSIGLDDAWGWTRDGGMPEPIKWSDHAVLAGMAWLRRRSNATIDRPPVGAIQVLPPDPQR